MGQVVSIVHTPKGSGPRPQEHYTRVPLDRADLAEGRGIVGDKKGRGGRQLNVMLAEVLAELKTEGFKTAPGELGEQIVGAGVPRDAVPPGTRLRLGEAVIEMTEPRRGCGRFEAIQGKSKTDAAGRLGFLARVVTGGAVVVGDEVELLSA
jgi:MOSC domain-containing protein YiiM